MTHFKVIIAWALLAAFARASGIFDDFKGKLTVEAIRKFDLSTLRPDQVLVYGPERKVPHPVIEYALENQYAELNAKDKTGRNSLYYAALAKDIPAVRTLMAYGATGYFRAMYSAAMNDSLEILGLLLDQYKQYISRGSYYQLIGFAALNRKYSAVCLLLGKKGPNRYKQEALAVALGFAAKCTSDNTAVINFLLKEGAKVTPKNLIDAFEFYDLNQDYVNFLCLLRAVGPNIGEYLNAVIDCGASSTTLKEIIFGRVLPYHVYEAIEEIEENYTPSTAAETV